MRRILLAAALLLPGTGGMPRAEDATSKPIVREAWTYLDAPDQPPEETHTLPLDGGGFESGAVPKGWYSVGVEIVLDDDAPEGQRYARAAAKPGAYLLTPRDLAGEPGRPHFLTFRLKSDFAGRAVIEVHGREQVRTTTDHDLNLPDTGGEWKRIRYHVWLPPQATGLSLLIHPGRNVPEGRDGICVDDVRMRTATEAEMAAALADERDQFPAYEVAPRPGDGRNLALSVAKWEGRAGLPGRPFVIWAVGSSWTHALGDGYPLVRAIRERFPAAPPILYKRHVGSGTPWDYAAGWVQQFVAADQPDLVFTYTTGSVAGLDRLLTEVRTRTTADVIVASLHPLGQSLPTEEEVEGGAADWAAVREVCRKHGAEFVENRRELTEYLRRHNLTPRDLLADHIHQNRHGRTRIWDNVLRHVNHPAEFGYEPAERERFVRASATAPQAKETVTASDGWEAGADGTLRASRAGARLALSFVGNRADLIGRRSPGGGSVRVFVDGEPAERAAAFATTFLTPMPTNLPLKVPGFGPGDLGPHAVTLGANPTPQAWTIMMLDDEGRFRLTGSATGTDGEGRSTEPFTSNSGQVAIEPRLWGGHQIDKGTGEVKSPNRTGDLFTFDVVRTAAAEVSFAGNKVRFAESLVRNLRSGEHRVEVETVGDGEVVIDGFYVFEPPLKAAAP